MLQLLSAVHNVQLLMAFQMKGEMIRSGEGTLTVRTLEGLDASVLAVVAGQLIRAGKFPGAPLPGTFVWLLPSVGPQMGFEV